MDALITTAARALAAGDPVAALKRVALRDDAPALALRDDAPALALRDDAPALALRGIAMAQLGDFARAKTLLRHAARAFGAGQAVARARCIVAAAEIALAARDPAWPAQALARARTSLAAHGDRANAAHAQELEARHLLLIGRLGDAERLLAQLDPAFLPPALCTAHELALAGIAMRRLRAGAARAALERATRAAHHAGIPALLAEVEGALRQLDAPAARLIERGGARTLRLDEVADVLASPALVVDACRHAVSCAGSSVPLAARPILFTLLRALAAAWPEQVSRDALVARAFRLKHADESARARLRVELGRLRQALYPLAAVRATPGGFTLVPRDASPVLVLAPPVETRHTAVLALLADGEAWSSAALASALGSSQRNAQRALATLAANGRIRPLGQGRARRWMAQSMPEFTTALLLPTLLPAD